MLIDHWNNPLGIYWILPVMVCMVLSVRYKIWKHLRPYIIQHTLKGDDDGTRYRSFSLGCIVSEVLVCIFLGTLTFSLPPESPGYSLIVSSCVNLLTCLILYRYEKSLIKRYGLFSEQVSNNLDQIIQNRFPRFVEVSGHALLWLGMTMMVFSLMRPESGEIESRLDSPPMQVMVLFDLSRSMDATDVSPSRLGAARDEVISLLRQAGDNEVGLLLFTDTVWLKAPQTWDVKAIEDEIAHLRTQVMPTHGTDLTLALETALPLFAEGNHPLLNRVLLVTDGENHGHELESLLGRYHDVHVDVIALGSPNGIGLMDESGSPMRYHGEDVISRPDFECLKRIALQTEGLYIPYTVPGHSARWISSEWEKIKADVALEHSNGVMGGFSEHIQLYRYFLCSAWALLTIGMLMFVLVILYRRKETR